MVIVERPFWKFNSEEISPQCDFTAKGAVARPVGAFGLEGEAFEGRDQLL